MAVVEMLGFPSISRPDGWSSEIIPHNFGFPSISHLLHCAFHHIRSPVIVTSIILPRNFRQCRRFTVYFSHWGSIANSPFYQLPTAAVSDLAIFGVHCFFQAIRSQQQHWHSLLKQHSSLFFLLRALHLALVATHLLGSHFTRLNSVPIQPPAETQLPLSIQHRPLPNHRQLTKSTAIEQRVRCLITIEGSVEAQREGKAVCPR